MLRWRDRHPCIADNTRSHIYDRHYVYHPAWAARILSSGHAKSHVDVSSSLQFVAVLSAYLRVFFFDRRPVRLTLPNLAVGAADLLHLPFADATVDSLSCMHVIEHVGLGRYGDSLDAEGDLKAFTELRRVLAPGGSLLVVVPIGTPRICFNAHRVYAYDDVLHALPGLDLRRFSLIPDSPDDGGLVSDPPPSLLAKQTYGCGCFWFQAPPTPGCFAP